ncbi:unnamed protein product [Brassica oleracea]
MIVTRVAESIPPTSFFCRLFLHFSLIVLPVTYCWPSSLPYVSINPSHEAKTKLQILKLSYKVRGSL